MSITEGDFDEDSVVTMIYPVCSMGRGSRQAVLNNLESRLDQWYINLPGNLRYDPATLHPSHDLPIVNYLMNRWVCREDLALALAAVFCQMKALPLIYHLCQHKRLGAKMVGGAIHTVHLRGHFAACAPPRVPFMG
ncbi:uncharacterized protein EDB91DRAFT_1313169 [Suillus paluster]|uniref:uncharacterized protein n=1 Tax=Suillus paluster TaxID=48578 RepID=UPI001B87ECFB|nr:uncharacterized protein EDB91DRAFT_1313169 [Suillus paluster]KAG1728842.1 hypothetical protein EDB91DRAFT_1313169 [Suillus paluster]